MTNRRMIRVRNDLETIGITAAKYDMIREEIGYVAIVYFQNQEDLNLYRLAGLYKESVSLRFLNIQEPHPGILND
jgi:hypothetical protein